MIATAHNDLTQQDVVVPQVAEGIGMLRVDLQNGLLVLDGLIE